MSRKKISLIATAVVLGVAVIAGALAPSYVARKMNRVADDLPAVEVSAQAKALHRSLVIADLHADPLLWRKNILKKNDWGHVDVPRLQQGNVTLQAFSVVTKTPRGLNIERNDDRTDNVTLLAALQGWPVDTWGSLLQRALYQARKLHEFARNSEGELRVVTSQRELRDYLVERAQNPRLTAGWITLEGAQALEGDLANLQALYDAGYRMLAPTHFFDTELAGSAHGVHKGGLTDLGRQWVREMERRQLIIDLAHASNATIADVLQLATRPLIVSHTGVRGTCDNQRNLTDEQMLAIAQGGGLIGIGFWDIAVCGRDVQAIARAIRYAVDRMGAEHVALGSDFDGAVTTPIDAARLPELTQALLEEDLSEAQISRIMGQNVIDFLLRHLPEA